MPKETSSPARVGGTTQYAYPVDLARFVREHWSGVLGPFDTNEALPDQATLEQFFSACYQASLLREEERPVTFRAILAAPESFPADGMPPETMRRLEFSRSFAFDATELRRLSVAADTHRTLIGVRLDEEGALRIWGLVDSGTRWLRDVQGGRRAGAPLPPAPMVHVDAAGSITAYKGHALVAKLQSGRIAGGRADPFASKWLPKEFTRFRDELMARHERAAKTSGGQWAPLEPDLPRQISERMMKRAIALLRDDRHGATIAFVPTETSADLGGDDPYIDLRYPFAEGAAQRSFPDLVVSILNRLARIHGGSGQPRFGPVGWREFELATDDELATLDEALFETAHLIAGLASADGVVVLNKQHDLLGFRGMISGRLPAVRSVARALDLEASRVIQEGTGNVGARHRSAYRLAGALPGAVVIVISQDGGVRFVAQKNGRVTYWEQE
jgi:hypothetical protein